MSKDWMSRMAPEPRADIPPAETQRIAPGKVTRTSKLAHDRKRTVQRKASVPETPTAARNSRTAWEHTMDPWMDMAHRGLAALGRSSASAESIAGGTLSQTHGGQPMPGEVQAKMEHAFGADFSGVRIHQGPQATAIGALAYTQGTNIHFAPGQYEPGSQRGQELLGHELTHVVQQSQGRVSSSQQVMGFGLNSDATLEREADDMGARAARGQIASLARPAAITIGETGAVQRKKIDLPGRGTIETKDYTRQQLESKRPRKAGWWE